MTLDELKLEILKVCFRPGNSPAVNIADVQTYVDYVLDKKGSTVPVDFSKKVVPKK